MKIFTEEMSIKSALLKNKTCSAIDAPIKITEEKPDLFLNSLSNNNLDKKIIKTIAQIVDNEHPDLMYGSAILVSTVVNKNDDAFLPEETWKAISSAINQPFNDDHIEYDIIGHIINSQAIDKEGKVIADHPPDYFDVTVDFVVYKSIFPKVSAEIAEKGPQGQKFVSMECRFKGFDYGLISEDGSMQIVARNEQTAFLTKYLRAYGGNGLYNSYKIVRVLRDFRFVGMGSVDNPANPASEFTRIENYSSDANFEKHLISLNKTEGKKMDELQKALEKITALETELATVKQEKTKAEDKVKTLESDLGVANTKAEVAEQKFAESNTKLEQLNTDIATIKTERDNAQAKLDEINKEAKANERFAKLADLGIVVKDEQKAKFTDMSDEAFASILEFTSELASKAKASEATTLEQTAETVDKTKETLEAAEENKDTTDTVEQASQPTQEDTQAELTKAMAGLVENLRKNRKNSRNTQK